DNDPANGEKYGKLYNWYAVTDPRKLAPKGWHIPSDAEWTILTDHLGGETVAGGKMKSTKFWASPNTDATNKSGFSGLPGGACEYDGMFNYIGLGGYWWSSTEDDVGSAWCRCLFYNSGVVGRYNGAKQAGFSVLCLKQEEVKETQVSTVTQEGSKDIIDVPDDPVVVDPDEGKIFTVVEEMPTFPGGEAELFKYLQKNIKFPPIARENGIQGRVFVTFVVDKDGKVKDAKVLRGIGGGCDEEALRVVRSMPDWKAGKQNGRAVSVQYNLPINFTLR
ncbi:MAG: TonB family protein, partial [Bacteroidota bacterium]